MARSSCGRGGTDESLSALNAGQAYIHWRANGATEVIKPPAWDPDRAGMGRGVSYPSVGSRFVTWWDDSFKRLNVYGLTERTVDRILEY